ELGVTNADMSTAAKVTVEPRIEALVRRASQRFRPEKVILFGSHATGQSDPRSDIDLLVVMDFQGRPVDQAVAIRQYLGYDGPLDVLVRTPEDLHHRLTLGDWFLREVVEQGTVLYERSG